PRPGLASRAAGDRQHHADQRGRHWHHHLRPGPILSRKEVSWGRSVFCRIFQGLLLTARCFSAYYAPEWPDLPTAPSSPPFATPAPLLMPSGSTRPPSTRSRPSPPFSPRSSRPAARSSSAATAAPPATPPTSPKSSPAAS